MVQISNNTILTNLNSSLISGIENYNFQSIYDQVLTESKLYISSALRKMSWDDRISLKFSGKTNRLKISLQNAYF